MKFLFLFIMLAAASDCFASDVDSIRDLVKLGSDAKGIHITTNSSSIPFVLLDTNLNISSIVGSKWYTNTIGNAQAYMIGQFVPVDRLVGSRISDEGYYRYSGRYAVLIGRSLTLHTFEFHVAAGGGSKGDVLAAYSDSVTFQVAQEFTEEARKLKLKKTESK